MKCIIGDCPRPVIASERCLEHVKILSVVAKEDQEVRAAAQALVAEKRRKKGWLEKFTRRISG